MICVEIRRSSSATQGFYWRIVAANGRVLAQSETYVRRVDAERAAEIACFEPERRMLIDKTKTPPVVLWETGDDQVPAASVRAECPRGSEER